MSTAGVYLLASTEPEGLLFRHCMGLGYDTIAVMYASFVYVIECATGAPPSWYAGTSPCAHPTWVEWLASATCLRSVQWIPTEKVNLSRFVAATCLSSPPTLWQRWSPSLMGTVLDTPPQPSPHPYVAAPVSVWETLTPPTHLSLGLTRLYDQVAEWTHALDTHLTPTIDLNVILQALGLAMRTATSATSATMIIWPPSEPRRLLVPELNKTVPLMNPCLDAYTHTEIEQLNYVLHTPDNIPLAAYDELREVCQKKLESLQKDGRTK